MKTLRKYFIFAVVILVSCQQKPSTIVYNQLNIGYDSLKLESMADTIVCDIVIKNPDKEDQWTASCLKYLKRDKLIDTILNQVYSSELQAFDYYTNQPMRISDVKKMEKEISNDRNMIGKIQFREKWMYDPKNKVFIKKVYSMIFGYETYDDKGFVKGYKPLFKVVLP